MTRIFLTLSSAGILLTGIAFVLGLQIDDPRVRDVAVQSAVSTHMMTGLGGLCFEALVHAIVFTYFMGTGRWIEETSRAYQLDADFHKRNQKIKYRILPGMVGGIVLLVLTGAFGGAADPASPVAFSGWLGLSPATIHLLVASVAVAANLAVHIHEFRSIEANGGIVDEVLSEVRRIRTERGLEN